MLDFLNKVDIIPEEAFASVMKNEVEPYLERKGREGELFALDGTRLHYEAYEKLLSRGSIVILHGFTESAEKFREAAYYFRKSGYSVFSLDMEGHGKSHRSSAKKEKVEKLLTDGRVDFIVEADYREGSELDETVKLILQKMAIVNKLVDKNHRQRNLK